MTNPVDALLSLSAIETAVYDPPRLPCARDSIIRHIVGTTNGLWYACKHCGEPLKLGARKQPCPSRPVPDPDWQACLFAADLCEDVLQDPALGAWWRWLESEKKVPRSPRPGWNTWDWWYPDKNTDKYPERSQLPEDLMDATVGPGLGRYDTRRAAYLDLARAVCDQWRQEHEMRKEMAT